MQVFITGGSGWIGSAVIPELIDAGHEVTALARSDASAAAQQAAGATPVPGSIDDLDVLAGAASAADGVIHLAFKHDLAFAGDVEGALGPNRRAIDVFGDALAGSDRPLVIASGVLGLAPGRVATEADGREPLPDGRSGLEARLEAEQAALALATRGVRASAVRIAPTCHGDGDHGFLAAIVAAARHTGISGYLGDGTNRWPAVHRFDTARLFRLALERAEAGSALHAVGEQGVELRAVAEAIGTGLGLPVAAVAADDAVAHFGFLAGMIGLDSPASNEVTRRQLGWEPREPGLIDDIRAGVYFR